MIEAFSHLAVVPILVGPLQVFLAMLPAILLGLGSLLLALFKPSTFKLGLRLLWRVKLSILVALAVLSGTVYAARAVWLGASGAVNKAEARARDWPLFRGNLRRTGAASGADPLAGGVNWAFATEAKTFHASPTVVGNRVYITSAEIGVFSNRGAVYCLDADTGGVVWKSAPVGFRATFSSPVVSGKYLVTGEGLHEVRDGRITCLDIERGGAVLWTFRTKGHVESSGAIADGRVIIGAGDDGYYCLRLEPDAKGNPVLLWHLEGGKYPDAENDPIVHEGRAYLGLGIGGRAVVCVNAETGRELWRVPTPSPVFAPPTIARGKLFIGMGQGNFVQTEEEVIAAEIDRLRAAGKSAREIESAKKELQPGGEAWCIDLATHKVEWRFKTGASVLGAIVAGEDRLFVPSRDGTVYSVGFDGKPITIWNARAPIIASLAAAASHLYAVTEGGRLFALEQASLRPVWEMRLGTAKSFLSSPVIARGHVYVGSPENGLLCVGHPAAKTAASIWSGHLGGAGIGGNPEGASLPVEGQVISRWPETVSAPAAVLGDRLFVPIDGPKRRGMVCLQVGASNREAPAELWFFPTKNRVSSSPAASTNCVVFSDGARGMSDRRLHFLNAAGREFWAARVEPDAHGMWCLTQNAVLVEDEPSVLTSFDVHGGVGWRQIMARLAGLPVVADGRIVVLTEHGLIALDELEGTRLWQNRVIEALTGPIIAGKAILVGTVRGIDAYRVLDGAPLWQAPVGSVKVPLVQCGALVAAVSSNGELIVLDPVNGAIHSRQPGALPDLPPLPVHDALLFAGAQGIMRLSVSDGSLSWWLALDPADAVTSPLVVAGESVFFATGAHGLVGAGKPAP